VPKETRGRRLVRPKKKVSGGSKKASASAKKSKPKRKRKIGPKRAAFLKMKSICNSVAYKKWRIAVFQRDRYTCQLCGQKGGKLECHHIRPKYKVPDLILVIDNGCTLCMSCHRQIVTRREESFYYIFDKVVRLNNERANKG